MSITLSALQKQRRDTAANWTTANPTLLAGEIGIESDTSKWKVGDGTTAWNSLAYVPAFSISAYPLVNADISATAEIAVSKLADGTARQLLQTDAAGTGVEWASNIDVPGTLDVTGAATFDAGVTIQGDLTVNGTTTTIDTQNLIVEDKNVVIGQVTTPTDVTADGGGITLKGSTDKTINWVDATDAWTFSEHVNLASGKGYYINGTQVLSSSTLGSGVTGSSLTSVGTIGTGVWQGTAINKTYLDSTLVSTGDTGTVTSTMIADGTIVNGDINASAAIAGTKISPDFGSQTVTTTGVISAALGTAGAPTITFTGDLNTGIYSPGADQVAVATGGTGRLFIDSSGRVGLGTSSPTANAHVSSADVGATTLKVSNTSTGGADWTFYSTGQSASEGAGKLLIHSGSPRVTIDTSGRVGIGTASPGFTLDVNGSTRLGGSTGPTFGIGTAFVTGQAEIYTASTTRLGLGTTGAADFSFYTNSVERGRWDSSGRFLVGTSTSSASTRAVFQGNSFSSGQPCQVYFQRDSSSSGLTAGAGINYLIFADNAGGVYSQIAAEVDGNAGTNDYPGRLVFSTTADGASSPTARMVILQNGGSSFFASTSGIDAIDSCHNQGAGTVVSTFIGRHSATGLNSGTVSIRIYTNGNIQNTNNSYGALSDIKLKENIVDAGSQWNDLKALQVRKYNLKEGQTHTQIGLIAQEAELVSPGLVYETPDRDEDGNETGEVTKGVNYSVLYMKAVKALQEAMERIEVLEQRLADAGIA